MMYGILMCTLRSISFVVLLFPTFVKIELNSNNKNYYLCRFFF